MTRGLRSGSALSFFAPQERGGEVAGKWNCGRTSYVEREAVERRDAAQKIENKKVQQLVFLLLVFLLCYCLRHNRA